MFTVRQMLKKNGEFYSDITLINTRDSAQFPYPAATVVTSLRHVNTADICVYSVSYYGLLRVWE